jgi:hypothetical protein
LHLDLGSGALRLRASNGRLDDGNWHKIDIVRNRRTGTLRLDDESHDFETPGKLDSFWVDNKMVTRLLSGNLLVYGQQSSML